MKIAILISTLALFTCVSCTGPETDRRFLGLNKEGWIDTGVKVGKTAVVTYLDSKNASPTPIQPGTTYESEGETEGGWLSGLLNLVIP